VDAFITSYSAVADRDLMLCHAFGAAYQADTRPAPIYGERYFENYAKRAGTPIANELNAGRVAFVNKHVGRDMHVLDIGVGSGEFILSRNEKRKESTWGFDVNKVAEKWLRKTELWSDDISLFHAFTFWDVLEHVSRPADYLDRILDGCWVFTSIPIFTDLTRIRESKHYKPGEHLYYFTEEGFVNWMGMHGFWLIEVDDFETRAGRESILSFAFRKHRDG
jgi:hypothetical protein